jgi:hypothetical protein
MILVALVACGAVALLAVAFAVNRRARRPAASGHLRDGMPSPDDRPDLPISDHPHRLALAPWLTTSLGIALLSFLTGLFGPLGAGDPNSYVTVLLLVSLSLSFLWVVVVVVASIRLRRRALWLLIGAPGALCWPIILALVIVAISGCDARQPGCLP